MSIGRIALLCFFFFFVSPFGYVHEVQCNVDYLENSPVEKVKPREKKPKKKLWKIQKEQAKAGLEYPALNFWLICAIVAIVLVFVSALLIFFGLAPWIITLSIMLSASVIAFLILVCIITIDVPEFPKVMDFVITFFSFIALMLILGIAFLIWGLTIGWGFGWIIGLIMLGLFLLFLGFFFLSNYIQSKR